MAPGDLLTQLGAFAPGFAVAVYLYLHARSDAHRHRRERHEIRKLFLERDREHMTALVDLNRHMVAALEANTAALHALKKE